MNELKTNTKRYCHYKMHFRLQEKRLKKIQYQQELKAQIEQKEFEKELTKAKDIEEEERLTRYKMAFVMLRHSK